MRKILYTGLRGGLEVMPWIFRGEGGDLGKWERCQKLRIYHTQIAKKSLGRSDQRSARGGRASAQKTPKKLRNWVSINPDSCEKKVKMQNLRWGNVNTAKTVIDRDEWFFHGTKSPSWHPETFILDTPIPPEGGDMGPQTFAIWCFSQNPSGSILDRKESF